MLWIASMWKTFYPDRLAKMAHPTNQGLGHTGSLMTYISQLPGQQSLVSA
jgi:hypothetical protein